jgi:hypothetical protein
MTKTTAIYWNTLSGGADVGWTAVPGMAGIAEERLLSIDPETGEYTKLTRFLPGCDTTTLGAKIHPYPEEIFVVSGRIYDATFDRWLEPGDYISRGPFEIHGPFKTDEGAVVLELSFPQRVDAAGQDRSDV